MEYIIILGFSMLLLFPLLYLFYSESSDFEFQVTGAQMDKIAQTIVDSADAVYYHGAPSQTTVTITLPEDIRNITIQGSSISFLMQGNPVSYEVVKWSAANLTGSITPRVGIHHVFIRASGGIVVIQETS